MQKFTQKYVLIHGIEELQDGYDFSMDSWPLHVTLADVFSIEGDPGDLLDALRAALAGDRPVLSKVVGDEWFGEHKNVHVRLLDKTDALQGLHENILAVLGQFRAQFNHPEYIREGYRPHSTVQKDKQLYVGDSVVFNSVTLVDMFPDENPYRRRVIGTVPIS